MKKSCKCDYGVTPDMHVHVVVVWGCNCMHFWIQLHNYTLTILLPSNIDAGTCTYASHVYMYMYAIVHFIYIRIHQVCRVEVTSAPHSHFCTCLFLWQKHKECMRHSVIIMESSSIHCLEWVGGKHALGQPALLQLQCYVYRSLHYASDYYYEWACVLLYKSSVLKWVGAYYTCSYGDQQ